MGKLQISDKEYNRLRLRLRRLTGQMIALENAFQPEMHSGNILQQLAAARGALRGLMREIIMLNVRKTLQPESGGVDAVIKQEEQEALMALLNSYMK